MSRVSVIGAGTMGHGIAHVAASAGHVVTLFDVDPSMLDRALTQIDAALESGVSRGKLTEQDRRDAFTRVTTETDFERAVGDAEIVIEAVPEILALKRDLFARFAAVADRRSLLATNTSSLSVTEIAAATDRPEMVVGMHFFNPVAAMKLVEIVRGEKTADHTLLNARAFTESLGKTSIVVADSPGFATSRLGVVLGLEAMRMLEQGVAAAADIDAAMELGYNHPVGPLRLTDIVGLDVRLAVADRLHEALGGQTYEAPEILRRKVADGDLGRKTGRGFYDWPAKR